MHSPAPLRPEVARLGSLLVLLMVVAGGCYTFSGASLPAALSTVAIPPVESRASGAPPDLDQRLADALVERFADRTRLDLESDEDEADLVIRATVERYSVAPAAVTGDEVAALNRVTLGVRVVAMDRMEDVELLSRTFTATADFAPDEGLAGESDAANRALEQVAQDAFTAATSDW
ncbi:MAG: LPS assembly lipoprotein LptE [Bacteroidota bacterium]